MPVLHTADQEQLQKLLLGQLSTAEVERLATEYADDDRLAELAESLAGKDDALLALLHNHETAVVDPEGERLVERLLERLKPALPAKPRDDTAAMKLADASTEPSSPEVTGKPQKLPERLEYYRPIKVLGQGGMGTVYLAEDTRLGREVAIKTLRPELAANPQAKERFLREARSAAKLEHDNVIPIYSVGEADGTPFLAMPFLKGEPLDALIRRTAGPLPVATAVRLAREMASGLAAAHARGLIHRDIKPANIWLEAPTGRVKILDFGLAKAADAGSEADSETNLTASGAIVGTPAYMAPEQASGHAVDGRADLFSLGCVLYELLSGKRAFSGPNTMSILMSLANHTPPAPDKLSSECPAALSRLVMQLLEKDPAKRPASAEAVIQALEELDIAPAAGGWALLPVVPNATGKSAHPPSPTQTNTSRPSDSSLTLPATAVLPVRKRAIPKQRVALALAGVLLTLLAAVVYRIQTDKGTLVVEINDDTVEAKLKASGLEIHDTASGRKFSIRAEGSLREAAGDFKVVDGQGLKLVVLDADGLELKTNEFKLVRGDKVRALVKAETNAVASTTSPPAVTTNPDRRAAEYVLSIGGRIVIEQSGGRKFWTFRAVDDLPSEAFELTSVNLAKNQTVSDAELAVFKDCEHLTSIDLSTSRLSDAGLSNFKNCKLLTELRLITAPVTDAGLAHFKDCKNLTNLTLRITKVTDAGLAHFQDCKDLTFLDLNDTVISDVGLAHTQHWKNLTDLNLSGTYVRDSGLSQIQECRKLTTLDLSKTKVSDAGLEHLRDFEYLTTLNLGGAKVSDAGLKHLKELKNLTHLDLQVTQVTDAGLQHLKNCKNLTHLNLRLTQVTDAGLGHLADCQNLNSLKVNATKVTEAGLKKLSAALPGCKIEWDGGVIEPTVSPDRLAAEWALSAGVVIQIRNNGGQSQVLPGESLPAGKFELVSLNMPFNERVSDASLAVFKNCRNVSYLNLIGNRVSDVGIAHFKDCQFEVLMIGNTQITEAGLVHFKDCKKLTYLVLGSTKVTDAGLAYFKDCKNLTLLDLNNTKLSDAGLVHFKDCKHLGGLGLSATQVSDAGLDDLAKLTMLTALNITGCTKVTEAGVKKLSAALPGCKIEWDGGVIEPTVSPDRRAAEWALSIGGTISIKENAQERQITAVGELPREAFELGAVNLNYNSKVTDAGLAHFQGCKNLKHLNLGNTQVSDAGLAHFKDCRNLASLSLFAANVGDAGLANFKDCKNFTILLLEHTKVTDAGLAHFKDCKNLEFLSLAHCNVSDAGLANFKGCKNLTHLVVTGPMVTDVGLANFQDCKNLTYLGLSGSKVTDLGLANFQDCKNLTDLGLYMTQVSDAGLAHFKDCKNLTTINLTGTQVSDAGLAHFKDCKNLTTLSLQGAQVSDAGLAHLKDCKNLTFLFLDGTQVSDAGLAHFKDCKNLATLALRSTQVSDAGLVHFKDCKNLTHLFLDATQVSDAGLADLAGMQSLQHLPLYSTRVSLHGFEQLKLALPKCVIGWSERNRSVAESVLALGGTLDIGKPGQAETRAVKIATDLPGDYFQVRRVSLAGVAKPLDKLPELWPLLSALNSAEFDRLESIDLSGLTGLNYDFLIPIHGLQELSLANAGLNDATLVQLPKLPALKRLVLDGNEIRGEGLAHLSGRPELIDLSLGCPSLTDLIARNLAELKHVKRLSLAGSGLSDVGIKHLAGLKNLESLDLHRTKVTAAGIDELKKALPKCKIEWDGGVIEPSQSN